MAGLVGLLVRNVGNWWADGRNEEGRLEGEEEG